MSEPVEVRIAAEWWVKQIRNPLPYPLDLPVHGNLAVTPPSDEAQDEFCKLLRAYMMSKWPPALGNAVLLDHFVIVDNVCRPMKSFMYIDSVPFFCDMVVQPGHVTVEGHGWSDDCESWRQCLYFNPDEPRCRPVEQAPQKGQGAPHASDDDQAPEPE